MQSIYHAVIPSPIGDLYCAVTESAVTHILFTPDKLPSLTPVTDGFHPILSRLRDQLDEYFSGSRRQFDIPVELSGTDHQLKIWNALKDIPHGQTVTYAHIAKRVGSAPIAVGQAVGKNRVNILIPCHRVVGSDGSLTGYGGGLERKQFLLNLEAR